MGRPKKVTASISNIDDKVEAALAHIAVKQKELAAEKAKSARGWITPCSLRVGGETFQIQTLDKTALIRAAGELAAQKTKQLNGCIALGLSETEPEATQYQGHSFVDWFTDLNTKLSKLTLNIKERELARMEEAAKNLRSEDQKRNSMADNLLTELGIG